MAQTASLARMRQGRGLTVQRDRLKGRVVCGTAYEHLKDRKSRVLYPGPGFLSCALMPKKHFNGLINHITPHVYRKHLWNGMTAVTGYSPASGTKFSTRSLDL